MKKIFGAVFLVILLSAMAIPVLAFGTVVTIGGDLGTLDELHMPPNAWVAIDLVYCGNVIATTSSEIPVQKLCPRSADISYRVRVDSTNIPNLWGVNMKVEENTYEAKRCPDDQWKTGDIPSTTVKELSAVLKGKITGRFGTFHWPILSFIKSRVPGEIEVGIPMTMKDMDGNPFFMVEQAGWTMVEKYRPQPPPPAPYAPVVDYTLAPPAQQAYSPPPPAPMVYQPSAQATEVGPAAMAPNPAAIRFFLDNVELTQWVSTRPGERITVVVKTVAGLVSYEITGGGKTATGQTTTPGVTIIPIVVPSGDTILTVRLGQDTGTLTIKGVS